MSQDEQKSRGKPFRDGKAVRMQFRGVQDMAW